MVGQEVQDTLPHARREANAIYHADRRAPAARDDVLAFRPRLIEAGPLEVPGHFRRGRTCHPHDAAVKGGNRRIGGRGARKARNGIGLHAPPPPTHNTDMRRVRIIRPVRKPTRCRR